jgi:S1-C subfamily serine protease
MPSNMLGFNWIDAIILVLLILAVVEGVRIGFVTQVLVIVGFFGTLFVAGWLFPHLLPVHDRTLKTVLNTILVLTSAVYASIRCLDMGQNIHWSFRIGHLIKRQNYKALETILGSLPALVAGLVLVWLSGVAIGRLPFAGFSNSARDSRFVQQLSAILPPVPAVFAAFNSQLNPNSQPYVFVQPKPYDEFNYSASAVQLAESIAAPSIVRITSFGCGGVASGSGFVVAQHLVVTNAHVIAGITRPIVKYNGNSYEGVPVLFDPNLDFAIVRVSALKAPSLSLATEPTLANTTVAVLGYPGGNYRAVPGIVRESFNVRSRSIYDVGVFGRDAYGVQAQVDHGSSGGPIVLKNGRVAGIIFSKPAGSTDYAYAVSSSYLLTGLHKAQASHQRVGTGTCSAE